MAERERQRRLSFDALEQYLDQQWGPDDELQHVAFHLRGTRRMTDGTIARLIGLGNHHANRGQVWRYRREDVPIHSAEQFAHHLGTFPFEIWSDYYDDIDLDLVEEEDNSCA